MKGESINWKILTSKFSTEDDCVAYLEEQRWKNGTYCARYKCPDVYRHPTQKNQWYCRGCQKNFNVKIGTIFQRTRVSLDVWFAIITGMLVNKVGISTLYIDELFSVNKDHTIRLINYWYMERRQIPSWTNVFEGLTQDSENIVSNDCSY